MLGYERQMEGKVRDELAQQQKEQILRTQIRVLQNELGEDVYKQFCKETISRRFSISG